MPTGLLAASKELDLADIWKNRLSAADIKVVSWHDEEQSVILNVISGNTHVIENDSLEVLRACVVLKQGTVPEIGEYLGFSRQDINADLVSTVEHHLQNLQIYELVEKVNI